MSWFDSLGATVPSEASADMDEKKRYFLSIPASKWRTDDDLSDAIAVRTGNGNVIFLPSTIDKRTKAKCDWRGVKNFITFTWGDSSIGWLPMGE